LDPRTPERLSATSHWFGVHLIGVKSNRSAYGAVVTVTAGGRKWMRQCQSAGSYLSASDPRVHFGLGTANQVDEMTVRWPSGQIATYKNLSADRYVTVREGDSTVQ
jgi:hypothetical protein